MFVPAAKFGGPSSAQLLYKDGGMLRKRGAASLVDLNV